MIICKGSDKCVWENAIKRLRETWACLLACFAVLCFAVT